MGWNIRTDDTLAFFQFVEMIRRQVRQRFNLSVGPNDFGFVDAIVSAQAEVIAEFMLGEIAAAAQHLACLNEVSGSRFHERIQGEAVALGSLQLEANPMIRKPTLRLKN